MLALAVASLGAGALGDRHPVPALLFVVVLTVPVTVRRKYPVGAFLVVLAAGGL